MSSTITIIRHAPTKYNKHEIFMGTKNIPADVRELGGDKINAIRSNRYIQRVNTWYSSPLSRALDTAKAASINKDIIVDERLIERCLGDWEGVSKAIVQKKYPDAFIDGKMDFYHTPVNGETYEKFVLRISELIIEKCKETRDLVFVTHNGVFRVMKSLFTGKPLGDVFLEFEPYLIPQTFVVTDEILEKIVTNPFYTADEKQR